MPETPDATANPWHPVLHGALYARSSPIVIAGDRVTPGASLWSGMRRWVKRFRELGLEPGDRVVHAIEPGPGAFMALAAAFWEGLAVAMVPPRSDAAAVLERFDARAVLGGQGTASVEPVGAGVPDGDACVTLRASGGDPTPGVRLILSTSGTGGRPTLAALSDDNILSVVRTHAAALQPVGDWTDVIAMSALPWHHAFGLVIDLLPLVLGGAMVIRDPAGGRDPAATLAEAVRWGVNWMSMVPLQAAWLADSHGGRSLLGRLVGGVVGGAPASPGLCGVLQRTRLRVGYGQTEASPGITLGRPGAFSAGTIGRAVGCETRIGDDGQLRVRGRNVCVGYWRDGAFEPADADRWLDTGDRVRAHRGGYVFEGRSDEAFKLANGRLIDGPRLAHRLVNAGLADEAAVLPSADGRGFFAVLVGGATGLKAGDASPDIPRVRAALGSSGSKLLGVRVLAGSSVPRTGKGALDRGILKDLIARDDASATREDEKRNDHAPGPTVSFPSESCAAQRSDRRAVG